VPALKGVAVLAPQAQYGAHLAGIHAKLPLNGLNGVGKWVGGMWVCVGCVCVVVVGGGGGRRAD
jgi:hypothetical protein